MLEDEEVSPPSKSKSFGNGNLWNSSFSRIYYRSYLYIASNRFQKI